MQIKNSKQIRAKINCFTLSIALFFYSLSIVQAEDWIYKVRKGDNLWNLAVDHLIDTSYAERVQKLNAITDPWHLLSGSNIRIPSQWVRHYPAIVRVQNLQGNAQIVDDGAKQPHQLKVGDMVMPGDTVITDEGSTLVLDFLDDSTIMLGENSRLKIDKLMILENTGMSESQLNLLKGRLETQVAPSKGTARQFQIKTPVAVTSVRGTDYRVSAEKGDLSKTEVVGGKVAVKGNSSDKKIMLPVGFGTIAEKGKALLPPIKLLPAPDISEIPKPFVQVPIRFSLPALKNRHGYRVQIAKTEFFKDILFNKKIYSSTIKGPDLADGDYHIRIRGFDARELEGYSAQDKITINAKPESPVLVSPKQGEGILLEDPVVFNWSRQKDVSHYHLQVSNRQDFSELLFDAEKIDANELAMTKTMAKGKYFWRIAAIDQDGDGPFSDAQMFRRIMPAPELEAPEITDNMLTFRFRNGLPGQTYHFQMAEEERFNKLLADERNGKPEFIIPRPSQGGEYFIRIRTIDADGFAGPFAVPQSIDVPYDFSWLLTLLPLLVLIAL